MFVCLYVLCYAVCIYVCMYMYIYIYIYSTVCTRYRILADNYFSQINNQKSVIIINDNKGSIIYALIF